MLLLRVDHALGDGLSIAKECAQFLTNRQGEQIEDFIPYNMRVAKELPQKKNRFVIILHSVLPLFKVAFLPFASVDSSTKFAKQSLGRDVVRNRYCNKRCIIPSHLHKCIDVFFSTLIAKKVSHNTQMIVFDELSLDLVKQITKKKANFSLNDVLFTALSQAIHDYCQHQKCPVLGERREKTRCRALFMFGFLNKSNNKDDCVRNQM